MRELIAKGEEKLARLGIVLETDAIELFDGAGGEFFPLGMKARVGRGEFFEHSLLHEHFGHRLFFEQTKKGLALRQKEQSLLDLEEMILGDDFDPKKKIEFVQGDVTNPKIKKENGLIKVRYNPKFPLPAAHLRLQRDILMDRARMEPMAEAFADFVVYLIDREIKRPETVKDGRERLYDELVSIEESYGPLSALYSAGLARSKDPKIWKRVIKENLKEKYEEAKAIIKLGSAKPFSDMDYLVVVSDSTTPDTSAGFLDLNIVDEDEFIQGLRVRDIQYTVPVLDGEVLKGNKEELLGYLNKVPDGEAYRKSLKELYDKAKSLAVDCLNQFRKARALGQFRVARENIGKVLVNISYAESYRELVSENDPELIPSFNTFLLFYHRNARLKDARDYYKRLQENFSLFDERKVVQMLAAL